MSVADASVLTAALLLGDIHRGVARKWLSEQLRGQRSIHVPAIAIAEVAGAVARRTGRLREGQLSLRQLLSLPVLTIHTIDSDLARAAAETAIEARLKGCDAVYVALAANLGEPLVTLDAEQLERAGAVIRVLRPGEEKVQ